MHKDAFELLKCSVSIHTYSMQVETLPTNDMNDLVSCVVLLKLNYKTFYTSVVIHCKIV